MLIEFTYNHVNWNLSPAGPVLVVGAKPAPPAPGDAPSAEQAGRQHLPTAHIREVSGILVHTEMSNAYVVKHPISELNGLRLHSHPKKFYVWEIVLWQ